MAEVRSYFMSGEMPDQEWDQVLDMLGKLGIQTTSVEYIDPAVAGPLAPPAELASSHIEIPETLAEVAEDTQFVGLEHMFEYWKKLYRKMPAEKPSYTQNRYASVDSALHALVLFETNDKVEQLRLLRDTAGYPSPRQYDFTPRAEAGLVVVNRTVSGELRPDKILLDARRSVLQVHGLVDFMRRYEDLPQGQRLWGLNTPARIFTRSFAEQLQTQIDTASAQGRLFED